MLNNGTPPNSDPVSKLVFELAKLPGVGEKTATRLAYFILKQDAKYPQALASSILKAKERTTFCEICFTFTDVSPCRICSHSGRQKDILCVVEKPTDVFSIEKTGAFRGLYHVLHGVLSPLDGIGPDELRLKELMNRFKDADPTPRELIIATNPSVEGDATALYISRLFKPLGTKITKLAHGIPVGGQLEYSDQQTIGRAIENRMEIQ